MQVQDPVEVVRFAVEAHLQAHKVRQPESGQPGRKVLRDALVVAEPTLVGYMKSREHLAALATTMEDLELAPAGQLTRLVDQVQLTSRRSWSVSRAWWPRLREAHVLGTDAAPEFNTPTDVLIVAEAFTAYHSRLLERPPNSTRRIDDEPFMIAARQLIQQLCWLATGPFGVAHECHRLISYLAPLAPAVVTEFIRSGVVTTQVIRALDRSLRLARSPGQAAWNSRMRQEYHDLLASPPDKIYRRTNWLRALRRLRMNDYRGGEAPMRPWVHEQLSIALRAEKSYRGARATDRRYAFWCLAELTRDEHQWDQVRRVASDDPEVSVLVPDADDLRAYLRRAPTPEINAFTFSPSEDSRADRLRDGLEDYLSPRAVTSKRWIGREDWHWARTPLRARAIELLVDALFSPDVIRQRSAVDLFRASGPETAESVSRTTAAVLGVIQGDPSSPAFLAERCLAILGMLGRGSSVQAVDHAVRTRTDETLMQAVASAGDLGYVHPGERRFLMASVVAAVDQPSPDEDVVLASINALVASRVNPRRRLSEALADPTPAISTMLDWADRVLGDPLLPRT